MKLKIDPYKKINDKSNNIPELKMPDHEGNTTEEMRETKRRRNSKDFIRRQSKDSGRMSRESERYISEQASEKLLKNFQCIKNLVH